MQLLITGPTGTPSAVDLTDKSLSLGRAVDNDLAYPDDPALSRRHLTIEMDDEGWVVSDCGSRNGTIINDSPLINPHVLKAGDRICVGHLTIDVNGHRDERPRAAAPAPPATTIVTTLDEVLGQTGTAGTVTTPIVGSTRVVSALIRAGQELAGHRPLSDLFEVILDLRFPP